MTSSKHTKRKLFWNEGSPDIFANWYGDKNVTIAKVVSPEWHEDRICGGREAGENAARIVHCWNSHDTLVEALTRLVREAELDGLREKAGWDCWLLEADKALAKARGETHFIGVTH